MKSNRYPGTCPAEYVDAVASRRDSTWRDFELWSLQVFSGDGHRLPDLDVPGNRLLRYSSLFRLGAPSKVLIQATGCLQRAVGTVNQYFVGSASGSCGKFSLIPGPRSGAAPLVGTNSC